MLDLPATLLEHLRVVAALEPLLPTVERIAAELRRALMAGGKVLWLGNGGSAADAQHLAAELVGRFERERSALASFALTTDTSVLTAVANDYGFDEVFARQIRGLCRAGDVVVALSTSGQSPNVLRAVAAARELGAYTVGLSGRDGGALRDAVDVCLVVPSDSTARIQEAHILLGHMLCACLDAPDAC